MQNIRLGSIMANRNDRAYELAIDDLQISRRVSQLSDVEFYHKSKRVHFLMQKRSNSLWNSYW